MLYQKNATSVINHTGINMENNQLVSLIESLIKERDSFYKRGLELSLKKFQSDETKDIVSALVKAKLEFAPIFKNSKAYNYKYAPIELIIEATDPSLLKHGIVQSQFTDEHNILYTILRHTSGQWLESRIRMRESEGDGKRSAEQEYGSSQTYMRRYQLLALLGIQPSSEDTDAAPQATYQKKY